MKSNPDHKHRLWSVIRIFLKIIASILCICIILGGTAVIVVGTVGGVDAAKNKKPSLYNQLSDRLMGEVKVLQKFLSGSNNTVTTIEQKRSLLSDSITEIVAAQSEVDATLIAELESGCYDENAPLIVLDPYKVSPLTAVVLFNTKAEEKVSVNIDGDTALAGVSFDLSEYTTEHMIPIYGLYPGRVNDVLLTLTDRNGVSRSFPIRIETDRLPDALTHETVTAHLLDASAYQPGFTFTYMGNNSGHSKAAIDVDGCYRWALDLNAWGQLKSLFYYCGNYNHGESIYLSCGSLTYGPQLTIELNYLGKILNVWSSDYGAHHDIELTKHNTLLITGSVSEDMEETLIFEVDRATGEIVYEIDYADFLQLDRDQERNRAPQENIFYEEEDPIHINSVVENGNQLIISSRHQSSVVSTDRDGNIKWILADPVGYDEYYRQFILKPVDSNNFAYSYTQHAAELLPDLDNDPDTLDIVLFDNGDFRPELTERTSRIVHYRINEKEMTVQQIFSYGEHRPEIYSYRHGDADMLENGSYLGSFEPYDVEKGIRCAYGVEVTAEGKPVWEVRRYSTNSNHEYSEYRLERMNIYSDSANDLKIGIPANLFLKFGEIGETV